MGFELFTLDNGVKVVLVPMEGVQSVAVGVYVATGSRNEDADNNGISHFLEHMAFKGTKKFPTHREVSYLEGLGAIQNAWTDVHATAYWGKIAADRWKEGLEVAKELTLYPTIPAKELEIERGVILEEMRRRNDRPDEMVGEILQEMLYSGNSLGLSILGEEGVIKMVDRDGFVRYHDERYVSGNMVVAVAGKIGNWKVESGKWIEEWFGGLTKVSTTPVRTPADSQGDPRVKVGSQKKADQAHLQLGMRGVTMLDPRRYPMSILTIILGRGMSSRLFTEVREKRGLCYAIGASSTRYVDAGHWDIYAGLNVAKLEEATKAILGELVKIKEELVSEEELAQAKEKARGPLLFSMEDPINQMEYYAQQVMGRPGEVLDYDTHIDRLMQVTAEEVRDLARDLIKTEKLNLAIVGPVGEKEKENLAKLLKV